MLNWVLAGWVWGDRHDPGHTIQNSIPWLNFSPSLGQISVPLHALSPYPVSWSHKTSHGSNQTNSKAKHWRSSTAEGRRDQG